jgi:hypothetical protein
MRAGNYVHRYFVRQAFEKFKIFSNRPFFVRHCALSADNRQYETLASFELELIQTQMAQKPMLRAEVGMRVRCANKASAE